MREPTEKTVKSCERCSEHYLGTPTSKHCLDCRYDIQLENERKYRKKKHGHAKDR